MFKGGRPQGRYVPGTVPGAPAPGTPAKAPGEQKKRVRTKRVPKEKKGKGEDGEGNGVENGEVNGDVTPGEVDKVGDGVQAMQVGEDKGAVEEVIQKKVRGLNKKVCSPRS